MWKVVMIKVLVNWQMVVVLMIVLFVVKIDCVIAVGWGM